MKPLFHFLSSLRLTVVLLALSIVLIFFGTLDQVHIGIRGAQDKYFESFFAIWQYPLQWPAGDALRWFVLPIAGGYIIGPLLLANLVAAHFKHFTPSWKKVGIALIHSGVVVLIISQFLTDHLQEESSMRIFRDSSTNYLESFHRNELAVIETTAEDKDTVVSIPTNLIDKAKAGNAIPIDHELLPFTVQVLRYYKNTEFTGTAPAGYKVNQGIGARMPQWPQEVPETYKQDEKNIVSAEVELLAGDTSLGVWLVSNIFGLSTMETRQPFEHAGRTFTLEMRAEREYLPFSIHLEDLSHDVYPGTEIPLNFSSDIRIDDPAQGVDRKALVYMNHPLRYADRAYYQYQMNAPSNYTVFQVVRNPSWIGPYVACTLITLGLVFQFGYRLLASRKRPASKPEKTKGFGRIA